MTHRLYALDKVPHQKRIEEIFWPLIRPLYVPQGPHDEKKFWNICCDRHPF
jgi:hypothetical protein